MIDSNFISWQIHCKNKRFVLNDQKLFSCGIQWCEKFGPFLLKCPLLEEDESSLLKNSFCVGIKSSFLLTDGWAVSQTNVRSFFYNEHSCLLCHLIYKVISFLTDQSNLKD